MAAYLVRRYQNGAGGEPVNSFNNVSITLSVPEIVPSATCIESRTITLIEFL